MKPEFPTQSAVPTSTSKSEINLKDAEFPSRPRGRLSFVTGVALSLGAAIFSGGKAAQAGEDIDVSSAAPTSVPKYLNFGNSYRGPVLNRDRRPHTPPTVDPVAEDSITPTASPIEWGASGVTKGLIKGSVSAGLLSARNSALNTARKDVQRAMQNSLGYNLNDPQSLDMMGELGYLRGKLIDDGGVDPTGVVRDRIRQLERQLDARNLEAKKELNQNGFGPAKSTDPAPKQTTTPAPKTENRERHPDDREPRDRNHDKSPGENGDKQKDQDPLEMGPPMSIEWKPSPGMPGPEPGADGCGTSQGPKMGMTRKNKGGTPPADSGDPQRCSASPKPIPPGAIGPKGAEPSGPAEKECGMSKPMPNIPHGAAPGEGVEEPERCLGPSPRPSPRFNNPLQINTADRLHMGEDSDPSGPMLSRFGRGHQGFGEGFGPGGRGSGGLGGCGFGGGGGR